MDKSGMEKSYSQFVGMDKSLKFNTYLLLKIINIKINIFFSLIKLSVEKTQRKLPFFTVIFF